MSASSKRAEWLFNHSQIERAYVDLLNEYPGVRPTLEKLSEKTGIATRTIRKHMRELKFKPSRDPLRTLTPNVIWGLYQKATTGNANEVKLWLQVMEGWSEKQQVEMSGSLETGELTYEERLARIAETLERARARRDRESLGDNPGDEPASGDAPRDEPTVL